MLPIAPNAPISHTGKYGTRFASRADLQGGVAVTFTRTLSVHQIVADAAQFGAWHAGNIHPQLDGFAGYDAVEFKPEG